MTGGSSALPTLSHQVVALPSTGLQQQLNVSNQPPATVNHAPQQTGVLSTNTSIQQQQQQEPQQQHQQFEVVQPSTIVAPTNVDLNAVMRQLHQSIAQFKQNASQNQQPQPQSGNYLAALHNALKVCQTTLNAGATKVQVDQREVEGQSNQGAYPVLNTNINFVMPSALPVAPQTTSISRSRAIYHDINKTVNPPAVPSANSIILRSLLGTRTNTNVDFEAISQASAATTATSEGGRYSNADRKSASDHWQTPADSVKRIR